MKKQITGFTASGSAQPEFSPGDKWQDNAGGRVVIESNRFNRVTFLREGYRYPVTMPEDRFIREFKQVEETQ